METESHEKFNDTRNITHKLETETSNKKEWVKISSAYRGLTRRTQF